MRLNMEVMMTNTPRQTSNPLLLSVLLIIGLFCASSAWAGANTSQDFDANGDGQISFEEMMTKVERSARKAFDGMDRNHDGVLSNKDFNDVREGMQKMQEWLDQLLKPFVQEDDAETLAL